MLMLAARGPAGRLTRFWGKVDRDHNDHGDTRQKTQEFLPTLGTHPHHPAALSKQAGGLFVA